MSSFCNYKYACIIIKGTITLMAGAGAARNNANK